MNNENKTVINFYLAKCSIKDAKKKYTKKGINFYIIDINKIIKDLGYDNINRKLLPEEEFVVNYSISRKIERGIYSTKSDDILYVYKKINENTIKNLKIFLSLNIPEEYVFNILWAKEIVQ